MRARSLTAGTCRQTARCRAARHTSQWKDRAASCLDYLVNKGIDGGRVTAKGYGESVPVASNLDAAGREQNRRVEFNRTDNPECRK